MIYLITIIRWIWNKNDAHNAHSQGNRNQTNELFLAANIYVQIPHTIILCSLPGWEFTKDIHSWISTIIKIDSAYKVPKAKSFHREEFGRLGQKG